MSITLTKQRIESFQNYFSRIYEKQELITKNATLVVTKSCNLNCSYCYEIHKCNQRMSKETGMAAIDMLIKENMNESNYINSKNSEAIIIDFIGGEPLLEIELIDYLAEYFKFKTINLKHIWALNYMFSMTTNGILYDTPKVQDFIKKNAGHVSITITIDGNKELHDKCRLFPDGTGSYDIVEKAVKLQVKNNHEVGTKLTLAPENISYLVDAFKNLHKLGLKSIFANTVFEEGWNIEHAKVFYTQLKELSDYLIDTDQYKEIYCSLFEEFLGMRVDDKDNQNWCGGTGKMMAIDTDGKFYPCLRYLPFAIKNDREPLVIGNIVDGIESNEIEKERVKCLQCITRRSQSTDECYNCPIGQGCAWCSAYNYDQFGTADKRATYICVMHKARVLANVYFWNKLYKKEGSDKKFGMHVPKEWALDIINENEYNCLIAISK